MIRSANCLLFAGATAVLTLAVGCATNVPASQSAAKFVRETPPEDDEHYGKASATGAYTVVSSKGDDSDTRSWQGRAFVPEAAWTRWVSQQYDLSISVANQIANVDGNYWLVDDGTRFGLVHGVGLGYQFDRTFPRADDDALWNHNLLANAQGGAFFQGSEAHDGTVFAAARYTFSTRSQWQAGDAAVDDSDEFFPAHYATANVGWLSHMDNGASIAPELAFTYGRRVVEGDEEQSDLIFTVGMTITAPH